MGNLPIYFFALIFIFAFRGKPFIFSWKWMICTVSALYAAVFSAAAGGLLTSFLPAELHPYCNVLAMLVIFMAVMIALDIVIGKMTPGGEFYRFPSAIAKVLSVVCRGIAGMAVAVILLQAAAMLPVPWETVPHGEAIVQSGGNWMLRIAGVVDRVSHQGERSGQIKKYLDGLKYRPPVDEAAEKSEATPASGAAAPASRRD